MIDILAPRHYAQGPVTRTGLATGGRDLRPYEPFRLSAGGITEDNSDRQPRTEELLVLAALLLSFAVIFVAELPQSAAAPSCGCEA